MQFSEIKEGQRWLHEKTFRMYKVVHKGELQWGEDWYSSITYQPITEAIDSPNYSRYYTRTLLDFLTSFTYIQDE